MLEVNALKHIATSDWPAVPLAKNLVFAFDGVKTRWNTGLISIHRADLAKHCKFAFGNRAVHPMGWPSCPSSRAGRWIIWSEDRSTAALIQADAISNCCTGRSAGFSPLRMRSTYCAARRQRETVPAPLTMGVRIRSAEGVMQRFLMRFGALGASPRVVGQRGLPKGLELPGAP